MSTDQKTGTEVVNPDLVTATIDGIQVSVPKGTLVIRAAENIGIEIPRFCEHPLLDPVAACRQCLVEVPDAGNGRPMKAQPACALTVMPNMVVQTAETSPAVAKMQEGMLEFLLLNHPLDCPICDKGGECPLQDYSYTFGPEKSRMEFRRRTFDGSGVKADVDFGPTLMLNRNRCILCTRCVRFMRDIDTDAQIGIVDRGYGSEIVTFEEKGVHSLLSGNLMDICPVGAILTKDYRFRSRPWDNPLAVDTICTLCSKGCNTTAWVKGKQEWARGPKLVRFTPRFNQEVNGYWMCDIGRFGYHWIEGDDRLQRPLVRSAADVLEPADWREVLAKLAERLAAAATTSETAATAAAAAPGEAGQPAVGFLLSAHASHEEMFLVRRIAGELARRHGEGAGHPPIAVSWRVSDKQQPPRVKFRVSRIDAPNVNGALDQGLVAAAVAEGGEPDVSALREEVEAGRVTLLYVLDPGPDGTIGDVSWVVAARQSGRLPILAVQGVLMTELVRAADFVLPGASYVEKEAIYTNEQGRLQAVSRVMSPPADAMEDWQILVNLAMALGLPIDYASAASVRSDIAFEMSAHPELSRSAEAVFYQPVPARTWLQVSNPSERWKWDFLFRDLPPVKFKGAKEG